MDIYTEILSALETEERVTLATIIATEGSTPAAALSKMLVKKQGTVSVGTVGGGCMEGDVQLQAHRLYGTGNAAILSFSLSDDDVEHGLICGGNLDVLIEPVTRSQAGIFHELKSLRAQGEDCILATFITNEGTVAWKEIVLLSSTNALASRIPHLTSDLDAVLTKAYRQQETQRIVLPSGTLLLEPVTGNPSLIIFGGGHVSKYVSRAATMAGFRVTVVDDREKFANTRRFPEAAATLAADFTGAFPKLQIKNSTYIVIVTRGHRHDEIVLEQALQTPAKYIGMIGSKRKVITLYQHLAGRGVPHEALERVQAPIGIDLGAITAEEIAISIVAQLIQVRRGGKGTMKDMSAGVLESFIRTTTSS